MTIPFPVRSSRIPTTLYRIVFFRKMSYQGFIAPEKIVPPVHRDMKSLDRSLFSLTFDVWTVIFPDVAQMGEFIKRFKQDTVQISRLPFLFRLSKSENKLEEYPKNPDYKAVALNHKIHSLGDIEDHISPEARKYIQDCDGKFFKHRFTLDYNFWRADEILQSILPENLLHGVPTSFTKTGHVAHVNLKDEYKPYDSLIGQVILDKNPSIKTVVDKQDSIDTVFRTFNMKVIAGEHDLLVEQKESDCVFTFDFSKVYWNSRLSTEHGRLIKMFKPGDAVCDVMAGVGPFAVPAGKKQCIVFANDLNPESYKYLKLNVKKNKVDSFVNYFNEDGREFIRKSSSMLAHFAEEHKQIEVCKPNARGTKKHKVTKVEIPGFFSHYVMNLPESAIKFVDAFVGLFSNAFPELTRREVKSLPGYKLPVIHVHHFEKFAPTENPEPTEQELQHRIHRKLVDLLKFEIPFENLSFHYVRLVAPTKPMFCVSFTLPEEVAFAASEK
ncbi:hypothetical protein KL949_003508 [Ogataea haglerorum]|uniref:tRNA (guanine(37)-N1)-methyltransferase n=1 Tax=Ogataea haglerorum TaxID=1937702 RepID=A0ABQ7RII0_9ASCO|nr:hypothetical protein KL914_002686 [Ogataea haglerorum]KAG7716387.1 hypothetical protein KL913_003598 [Ogataea haglerorum]KAG7716912.1 hypothetical protein KL949_003508 [Ogataea haglerorum]KAG7766122.1 hypothetical protein KL946_002302 [Ogataea haglerorum]KAG7787453.1 hypothetical protein KL945_003112 [Ogataea haglerorum]